MKKEDKPKIINLEEILQKRETALIEECSDRGEYEQINRIALRKIWREQRRTAIGRKG